MTTPPRVVVVCAAALFLPGLSAIAWAACDPGRTPTNPIVEENCEPGSPSAEWEIDGAGDPSIQGFATDMSFNVGDTANFKIKTEATSYTIDIYRLGYYSGLGARKITSIPPSAELPQVQPDCMTDTSAGLGGSGLYDCGNWGVSASWGIPADAVSGIYFALLTRSDTGGKSHIYFIVRDDDRRADLLFQTSDTTWQAYNPYGLGSVYGPNSGLTNTNQRTFKVSYNRPIVTRERRAFDFLFHSEYPMLRWLEANGYDVTYSSGVDTARSGSRLLRHKVFLSVGHDEYWSGDQRANVEAARDAGVNLAFFSGNEVFWKTRWENSVGNPSAPYRTLVTYKETAANAKIDPSAEWTGTWRDPRFSPPSDGGRPENSLTGTLFAVNGRHVASIKIPAADGRMRFWRNTAVANQADGEVALLPAGSLGFEWDVDADNGFRPAGLFHLSTATYSESTPTSEDSIAGLVLLDYGSKYGNGTATHHLTLYRAPSGALVFGAGTINWSWGLDEVHDATNANAFAADGRMQQATVNLFADMGAQPATLQSGLVPATKSTDTTPPSSSITSPAAGSAFGVGTEITLTGSALDSGGGVVGGVEISTDGGTSWHPASGRENWSYTWVPKSPGAFKLVSRAVDDSGNVGPLSTEIDANITCPCTGFSSTSTPATIDSGVGRAFELGVKFRSDVNGFVTGLRFYKSAANTGTHIGHLWTSSGTLLATATFTNETASGWQQVSFSSPVPITAGTTYVASYFAPAGRYSVNLDYFVNSGVDTPPLHFLQNGIDGGNGVFKEGTAGFPTSTFRASNYWVDIVFTSTEAVGGGEGSAAPTVESVFPAAGATGVSTATTVRATFSRPADTASVNGSTFRLLDASNNSVPSTVAYDAVSLTATLTPTSALTSATMYTAVLTGGINGIKDTSGNALASDSLWSFTTSSTPPVPPATCCSVWGSNVTPSILASNDSAAVELGVKFRSDVGGFITGVRFYKGLTNTGTHIGNLWTKEGVRLASATFTNETASGWQQVTFPSAVAIAAGTTYVASYFAPQGHYSLDLDYFAVNGADNGPLHLLRNGLDGGNGVFTYASSSTFPSSTHRSSNYWVDVVFANTGAGTGPSISSLSPVSGAIGVSVGSKVTATFDQALDPATVNSGTFRLLDSSGTAVSSTVTYDAATLTATLTPTAALAFFKTYTAIITGGSNGVKNASGIPLDVNVTWSFTTAAAPAGICPCSMWDSTVIPGTVDSGRNGSVELGVKFRSDVNGFITGLKFYKSVANTGTHVAHLWTGGGTLLASATFTNETASGWQEVAFVSPVAINANTTYVASYFTPVGRYSVNLDYFLNSGADRPPLHFLKNGTDGGNGVFDDTAPFGFPTSTFRSSNYWVDVVLDRNLPASAIASVSPADGAVAVAADTTVTATFTTPMNADSINAETFLLLDQSQAPVPATVSYDAAGRTAQFTPLAPLKGATTYIAVLKGGAFDARIESEGGQSLAADYSWSFTTANRVTSLTLDPSSIGGGSSSTGTVSLSAAAPAGGATVMLSSSDTESAVTAASVVVPEGHTSATFSVSTAPVSTTTEVTISASFNGTQTAKLTLLSRSVASLVLDAVAVIGGNDLSGTVTLTEAAPSGGVVVMLTSDNEEAASAPASVTIPAGAISANFVINTSLVSSSTEVTISASLNASAKTATLMVNPRLGTITSLVSSKNPGKSGESITFTATVKQGTTPVNAGTVTFRDGSTVLGQNVELGPDGTAAVTTSSLAVGSHNITAEYSGAGNYGASSGTVLQVISTGETTTTIVSSLNPSKYTETVTFTATVTSVSDGTAKPTGTVTFKTGATVLGEPLHLTDAQATIRTANLAAGQATITAIYSGDPSFATSTGSLLQTVDKAEPIMTWADPADMSYGTKLSATQLNATANVPGSFAYNPPAETVLQAGANQTLSVTFSPEDTANYAPATTTVKINVLQASAVITWDNPGDITYVTPLSAAQLNATANVPGSFVYAPALNTVLPTGANQTLSVTFTPTDSSNYAPVSKSVAINVLKATPAINWQNPADITYGTPLSATQLNATTTVPGTLTYTPAAGTLLNPGPGQTLRVDFTPSDGANYNSATKSVLLNVINRAPAAANDSYATDAGTALSVGLPGVLGNDTDADNNSLSVVQVAGPAHGTLAFQTNGTFVYTPSSGFGGIDSFTYKATDGKLESNIATVSIAVRAATSTNIASSLNPSNFGQAITFTATVSSSNGTPNGGTVEFFEGTTLLGTASVAAGTANLITETVPAGSRAIRAVYSGNGGSHGGSTSPVLTQTVNKATAASTFTFAPIQQQYSDRVTFKATLTPATSKGPAPAKAARFKVGTQIMGVQPMALNVATGLFEATLAVPLQETVAAQMRPGSKIVTAEFVEVDASYNAIPNRTGSLGIRQEDARTSYTGPRNVNTACATCNTTMVQLEVQVRELNDGDAGDIQNATVTFVNRATGLAIGTAIRDAGRSTATTAYYYYNWVIDLGASASQTFTVGAIVGNYYTRNSTEEDATVTVTKGP